MGSLIVITVSLNWGKQNVIPLLSELGSEWTTNVDPYSTAFNLLDLCILV